MKILCSKKDGCGFWKCAHHLGIFFALLFIICFFWWRPADLRDFHLSGLRMAFLGFDGFNAKSFVLGLVQSYLWAYVGIALWLIAGCCMKSGQCEK